MFSTKIRSVVACLVLFSSTFALAEDSKFIRVKRNKKNEPVTLEIATTTYEKVVETPNPFPDGPVKTVANPPRKIKVDLIGVVHIADPEYYDELNENLSDYDALLYELVAEKGTVIKKGEEREGNILSTIQKLVGGYLGLESQVSTEPGIGINYERKNFVHADMSLEELDKEMAKNGDSRTTLMLSAILENMKKQNKARYEGKAEEGPQGLSLDEILSDPNAPIKIKRMMADQFDKMGEDALGAAVTGYIIDKRNEAAMQVFDNEVKNGKTHLGIFYGAAHMTDFERRLTERGFKKGETQWNTAWDMRRGNSQSNNQVNDLFKLLENFDF